MAVGGVVLVVAVFGFALPRLASYRDVLDALSALSWPEIAALVVAVVINLARSRRRGWRRCRASASSRR